MVFAQPGYRGEVVEVERGCVLQIAAAQKTDRLRNGAVVDAIGRQQTRLVEVRVVFENMSKQLVNQGLSRGFAIAFTRPTVLEQRADTAADDRVVVDLDVGKLRLMTTRGRDLAGDFDEAIGVDVEADILEFKGAGGIARVHLKRIDEHQVPRRKMMQPPGYVASFGAPKLQTDQVLGMKVRMQ